MSRKSTSKIRSGLVRELSKAIETSQVSSCNRDFDVEKEVRHNYEHMPHWKPDGDHHRDDDGFVPDKSAEVSVKEGMIVMKHEETVGFAKDEDEDDPLVSLPVSQSPRIAEKNSYDESMPELVGEVEHSSTTCETSNENPLPEQSKITVGEEEIVDHKKKVACAEDDELLSDLTEEEKEVRVIAGNEEKDAVSKMTMIADAQADLQNYSSAAGIVAFSSSSSSWSTSMESTRQKFNYPGWEQDVSRMNEKCNRLKNDYGNTAAVTSIRSIDLLCKEVSQECLNQMKMKQNLYVNDRSHPNLQRLDALELNYTGWEEDKRKMEDIHVYQSQLSFDTNFNALLRKQEILNPPKSNLVDEEIGSGLILTYPGHERDMMLIRKRAKENPNVVEIMLDEMKTKQKIYIRESIADKLLPAQLQRRGPEVLGTRYHKISPSEREKILVDGWAYFYGKQQ